MRFSNLEPFDAGLPKVMRMLLTRRPAPWPRWVDYETQPKPAARVEGSSLRVTYINHATVLIQTAGMNILTDPHYSERCSPVSFVGPKRVHAPGIAFDDLPPIDLVLLSHNHYDHLDLPTIRRLCNAHECKIVAGLHASRDLPRAVRARVVELDWWVSADPGLKIHFVPVQHFSARSFHDRFKVLWGGFAGRLYFPGDTAFNDLGCERALGVHWGCFQLTDEPILEPLQRLEAALKQAGIDAGRFRAIDPGRHWDLA